MISRAGPVCAALLAGLLLSPAGSAEPAISVDGAWCRVSQVQAGTAFVYMTVSVSEADALVGASTPLADHAEILEPRMVKGREMLVNTAAIPLDPHGPTVLQPQGPHIILKGLKQKLAPGDSFTVTLQFDHGGRQDAAVKVLKQPPATGMPDLPKGVKLE